MKPVEIVNDIHWVGAVDWNSRDFHGYAVSPFGTTYNAFLVKDDKTTLFDTVKHTHTGEYLCNVKHAAGEFENIDYLVVNHNELDHSGALKEIIERAKPEKIICSKMGEKFMRSIFPDMELDELPLHVVADGEEISIGKRTLKFFEMRMLHWPDNMGTYIPEEKMLISSDAFGQNWATTERFSDEVEHHTLYHVTKEYFANIVQPFSPIVLKTLDKVAEAGLEIEIIAPDHGLIWRGDDVSWIIDRYREFAEAKPKNKALIVYDTMWHSTEHMASAIAQGLLDEGVPSRIMHVKSNHHTHVMTELMECGALVVGSPTHNNGILPYMASTLTYMKGLKPKNKVGGAFGSYGWSGESVKVLNQWLEEMKVEVVESGVKSNQTPDHEVLAKCAEYGRSIAKALKKKIQG